VSNLAIITEILLKVVLNTITLTLYLGEKNSYFLMRWW